MYEVAVLTCVNSLFLPPTPTHQRGIVSGSADHTVKFWELELISDEENPNRY